MSEGVSLTVDAAGVATIRLERPPVNALNLTMRTQLAAAMTAVRDDTAARAVVVWGGPAAFAAGADIKEMAAADPADTTAADLLRGALLALEQLPKITIAVVAGPAIGGGCELALACDFRFASFDAKFGQPEVRLGLMPGAGGTQRLPRLIGMSRAKDLLFSGRIIGAEEALAIGLVDRIVDDGDVHGAAAQEAARFARGPLALGLIKQAVQDGTQLSLEQGLRLERALFNRCRLSDDARAGIERFVDKASGPPEFRGS